MRTLLIKYWLKGNEKLQTAPLDFETKEDCISAVDKYNYLRISVAKAVNDKAKEEYEEDMKKYSDWSHIKPGCSLTAVPYPKKPNDIFWKDIEVHKIYDL